MSSGVKTCPQCGTEYPSDQRFCPKDGSTLRAAAVGSDLVGSVVADRYHVTRKLGEGGMGTVYLAEHVKMGRRSAVKVMNPGMVNDPDAVSRFNREAANASRINHPNVAAIYDFGETSEGLIYLAMEFVEGEPLTNVVEREGRLAPKRAAEIVRQTADALTVAHDLGIVHRDLKPDNIMVTRDRDGNDVVKVVDFGIAKAGNDGAQKVTKTGLVVGTPEYMSPEQLAGDVLDGRSDLYSLGLVAFNLLTGKLPFPSETIQEAMIMRLTDRPRTLAEIRPDVTWPAEAQAVLDRALARDAKDRYAQARQFGQELVKALASMAAATPAAAAEERTQVLGAHTVPLTAIAPQSGAPAAPAPANVPAGAPAAPVATRAKAPMFALGGGALAAAAIGAFVFNMKAAEAPVAPPDAKETKVAVVDSPTTAPLSRGVDAASPSPTASAPAQPPAVAMNRPVTTGTAAPVAEAASSSMSAAQVDATLDRLGKELDEATVIGDLSESQRAARTVGAKVDDLERQADLTAAQNAAAELYRGEILALNQKVPEGCGKLRRVQSSGALPGKYRARLRTALDSCDDPTQQR